MSENGTLAYLPVSSYVTETEVVLVDRRGHETRALPAADRYNHPRLSPDGGRIAVDIRSANSLGDVWVFQVGRSSGTRLTSEGGRDWGAEWTARRPGADLHQRAPVLRPLSPRRGREPPGEPLLTGEYDRYTGTVSRDGRLLRLRAQCPRAVGSSGPSPLRGKPERRPAIYANGFNLAHPALSPDGRWMAYDSDESGRVEVYVQSFPDPSVGRWKVSPHDGSEPMWTRGGRELVFRKGDSVMAVSMDLPERPERSACRAVWRTLPGQSWLDPPSQLRCLARW